MAKFYTEHDRSLPRTPEEQFKTPGYFPVSAALISVADPDSGVPSIMPLIGWGFLNRLPLLLGMAVCVEDYNNDYYPRGTDILMRKTGDFVLNIPTEAQRDVVTETGLLSRHKDPKVDKFKACGLTAGPGRRITSPHIAECPINFECVIKSIVNMGSHDLFLGEVVGCFTDGEVIECKTEHGNDFISMKRADGSILTLGWNTLMREVK
jgi:flavin reductase (DIM6/NTAB) family NADH-FMN oxidoreductase RutF